MKGYLTFYAQQTKNLHSKFGLGTHARNLLRALDDVRTSEDEADLRRLIKHAPAYRAVISSTIADLATFVVQNPKDTKAAAELIRLFSRILEIADTAADPMLPFMKFPAEVRQLVYRHYLDNKLYPERPSTGQGKTMYPASKMTKCSCSHEDPPGFTYFRDMWKTNQLALSEVSKAVRNDFMRTFYRSDNRHFYFHCTCEMELMLKENELLRLNVANIKFHWCGAKADAAFRLLRKCEGLRRLVVMPSQATTRFLVPRQELFNVYFSHKTQNRLTDARGMDELVKLRGLESVRAMHVGTRLGTKRTNEELANLNEMLVKYLTQKKKAGYGEDDAKEED